LNNELHKSKERFTKLSNLLNDKDDIIKRLLKNRDESIERNKKYRDDNKMLYNRNKKLETEIVFLKERIIALEQENEIKNAETGTKTLIHNRKKVRYDS
jgi:Mg2+ and Co2+ transporter CorA